MKNIRSIDLNLLVVFGALCVDRSTTKAALRLGLSQPAVSHALARLRVQLNDPLFVRASRGLTPTRRAIQLEEPVMQLLKQLDQVLAGPDRFDPMQAQITFKIATTDYFEQVALPLVLKRLESEAPLVTIVSRPTYGDLPKSELESGDIDLAIAGFYSDLPEGFLSQRVFIDDFVCIARHNHPRIKKAIISVSDYAREKHVLISVHGDMKSKSKDQLAKMGYDQQFSAGLSSFLSPGWIIANTNYLLTCPRKLAESYSKYLPLILCDIPIEMPKIQVRQVWHDRHHSDAAHIWFRKMIYDTCQSL
jgi:DNA-binding transcriptional LysR family regulator